MSSSLQVAGLASNFDWKTFVDQIIQLQHAPADRLATEKNTNTQKVSLLGTLGTKLASLQTSVQALKSSDLFGKRTAVSATASSTWGVSAATNTVAGSYKIAVSQLATAAKLSGAADIGQGISATDSVAGLTLANLPVAQAVTAGTFSVNGHKVTVALTDSLESVFQAISTATGGDVTATYDHTTDKVSLTSASGALMLGASNDTSNFLRALKLGNSPAATGTLSSSAKLGSLKTAATLATAGFGAAITAVDGAGAGAFTINGVSIAYNVTTDTLFSVLKRINDSGAGVRAAYNPAEDRVALTNAGTGDTGISVTEAAGGLLGALGLTAGAAFERGQDANFTINGGAVLSSASNTLDASSHGIAGLSVTADAAATQMITVAADTTAMHSSIQSFVDNFNSVQQFLDAATKVSKDSKGKISAAVLSDNREIQEWAHSLRTLAFGTIGGLTGPVKRINDLGLDFKAGTNELEIKDDAKLTAALGKTTADVQAFFSAQTTGFAAKLDAFVSKVSGQNTDQQARLNKNNTALDDQIAAIERSLVQQRALMESAFINMESAQSQLKSQQATLTAAFSTTAITK